MQAIYLEFFSIIICYFVTIFYIIKQKIRILVYINFNFALNLYIIKNSILSKY